MQMQINVSFDLGTVSGRAEFEQMFKHLLVTTVTPRKDYGTILTDGSPPATTAPPTANGPSPGRQEAAAKARAAKAAKQAAGPVEEVTGPSDDLSGPAGTNGAGDQLVGDDDPDELGLTDPSMSPGEAKDAGLALCRQLYAADKMAEVKALQKKYQVAKFYDVPVERGHEFYREALAISHKVMGPQA